MLDLAGNNWGLLTSYSARQSHSSSYGGSHSSSYSGLSSDLLSYLRPFFKKSLKRADRVLDWAIKPEPNRNIMNAYDRALNLSIANWQRNYRPAIQLNTRRLITSLANRGVLDSSVASHTLASLQSQYLNNLYNLINNVEQQKIKESIYYPLRLAGLLQGFVGTFGNLGRISKSSASSSHRSESSSYGFSYNPAPAVGLLTSLMGI